MTAFLTGFPGFLGSALTERLLARGESVVALVQPRYRGAAERRAGRLRDGAPAGTTLDLAVGDITEPELGLDEPRRRRERTTELYHLAAIYDLGVAREPAAAVNVRGTERVLDFAREAGVDRLHYVSTCYVSGRYDGVFGPGDLAVGQQFNNHYEATKYEAEVAVQAAIDAGLPGTVYRPAIAVGDSETGATQKYDGPYFLLEFVRRQPRVAVVPVQPGRRVELNVVPRNFVVDAMAELSRRPETVGETYQLCDPNPPTIPELLAAIGAALDRRVVEVPAPMRALGDLLARLPGAKRLTGMEPAAMDYFAHPTRYVSPNTRRALAGTDIACPPLGTYLDRLVAYWREHPESAGQLA